MRDTLKLELSQTKTVRTNAKTEVARFLGYEIHLLSDETQHTKKRRSINGRIGFRVPKEVIEEKCRKYLKAGRPVHREELLQDSDYSILETYQTE